MLYFRKQNNGNKNEGKIAPHIMLDSDANGIHIRLSKHQLDG